jgi:hypothetical protein
MRKRTGSALALAANPAASSAARAIVDFFMASSRISS